MADNIQTIKIAGPAGLGIKSGGLLLSKILVNHGYYIHDYTEYPSLIRGGHNTYQVSFSNKEIKAAFYKIDLLFSLKPNHWQKHKKELKKGSLTFSDQTIKGVSFLPFEKMVEKSNSQKTYNIISIGVVAFIYSLEEKICKKIISNTYKKKVKNNLEAFDLGYRYAQKNFKTKKTLKRKRVTNLEIYDGNQTFGWGFLKGGGNFYSAYPMTPSTGTLHFLAEKQKEQSIIVRHPEDEISGANMAAGAAFAGARAAIGTSGGGFALMAETISFCGMAEIGMVYYLVQRVGPATGMPTWTSQADLLFYIFSGHGEFPKIVLAPSDQEESFEFGWKALNLAENLQTPVVVISDKLLAESSKSILNLKNKRVRINRGRLLLKSTPDNFQRYSWQYNCGRSYRTIPGVKKGEFLANSYEHDQEGFSTENQKTAARMAKKRINKLKTALKLSPKPELFGGPHFTRLIISWGSNKGAILEALSLLNDNNTALLQIKTLWPIDPMVENIIKQAKETIIIENNQNSQLTTVLKTQFDFNPARKILKWDGKPFFPEELYEQLK